MIERLDKDGYTGVRVGAGKWVTKQRFLYEKYIGDIPSNSVVIFNDGDKGNFELDNLSIITRNQLAALNKLSHKYMDERVTSAKIKMIELNQKRKDIIKERA